MNNKPKLESISAKLAFQLIFTATACQVDYDNVVYFGKDDYYNKSKEEERENGEVIYFDYETDNNRVIFKENKCNPKFNGVTLSLVGERENGKEEKFSIQPLFTIDDRF